MKNDPVFKKELDKYLLKIAQSRPDPRYLKEEETQGRGIFHVEAPSFIGDEGEGQWRSETEKEMGIRELGDIEHDLEGEKTDLQDHAEMLEEAREEIQKIKSDTESLIGEIEDSLNEFNRLVISKLRDEYKHFGNFFDKMWFNRLESDGWNSLSEKLYSFDELIYELKDLAERGEGRIGRKFVENYVPNPDASPELQMVLQDSAQELFYMLEPFYKKISESTDGDSLSDKLYRFKSKLENVEWGYEHDLNESEIAQYPEQLKEIEKNLEEVRELLDPIEQPVGEKIEEFSEGESMKYTSKMNVMVKLAQLADKLDSNGKFAEADLVDSAIQKIAKESQPFYDEKSRQWYVEETAPGPKGLKRTRRVVEDPRYKVQQWWDPKPVGPEEPSYYEQAQGEVEKLKRMREKAQELSPSRTSKEIAKGLSQNKAEDDDTLARSFMFINFDFGKTGMKNHYAHPDAVNDVIQYIDMKYDVKPESVESADEIWLAPGGGMAMVDSVPVSFQAGGYTFKVLPEDIYAATQRFEPKSVRSLGNFSKVYMQYHVIVMPEEMVSEVREGLKAASEEGWKAQEELSRRLAPLKGQGAIVDPTKVKDEESGEEVPFMWGGGIGEA
jgi:hypothetical protein